MATFADSSPRITVSSAALADTDGDWVELFLATPKDTKWMLVTLFNEVHGVNSRFDIGTGSPGNQIDDILQDQFAKWTVSANTGLVNTVFSFPMTIPAGTRLWIRIKDEVAAVRDYFGAVTLSTIPLSTTLPTSSESFATQGGVESAPSFDVFGGFVTMFPSLAKDRSWLCLSLYTDIQASLSARFDLASGDPQTVDWGEIHFQKRADSSYLARAAIYNMPVLWPEGTKLSIRVKDDNTPVRFYYVGATIF